jgi:hypothetical protein
VVVGAAAAEGAGHRKLALDRQVHHWLDLLPEPLKVQAQIGKRAAVKARAVMIRKPEDPAAAASV